MTDRDRPLALPRALGDVLNERIVEADRPALVEHHDAGGRGDRLREGGQIEHGIERRRHAVRQELTEAVRTSKEGPVVTADDDHSAWQALAGHRLLHGSIDRTL